MPHSPSDSSGSAVAPFPVHTHETLPWVPSSGRRSEIAAYEASIPPLIADLEIHVSPVAREAAVSARAYATIERLAAAGVLRPIAASKRDMAWAAGDVLDEADVMVDRLRFG